MKISTISLVEGEMEAGDPTQGKVASKRKNDTFISSMDGMWKLAKFCGVYIRHDDRPATSNVLLLGYSVFVLLLHLVRFLQLVMTFNSSDTIGTALFSKVIGSTTLLETFVCTIALSIVNSNWKLCVIKWRRVQQRVENLVPGPREPPCYQKLPACCKLVMATVFVTSIFFFIYFVAEALFSDHSEFLALRSEPFTFPSVEAQILLTVFAVETVLCSSFHVLSASLIAILAYFLNNEFKLYHRRLCRALQKSTFNVEAWRLYHSELCGMLSAVDKILAPYIGVTVVTSTLILCSSLYYVIHAGQDQFGLLAGIWMIVMHEVIIWIIAVAGIAVNVKAHLPLDDLYDVDTERLSDTQLTRAHIFMMRLGGSPIGLTAWGFFTVDKRAILTIAGTVITYVVVVFQFQQTVCPTSSQADMLANNTTGLPLL